MTPTEFYEWLRAANPHLPPANTVTVPTPATLQFGPDHIATLTIAVMVALPDVGPE